MSPSAPMPWSNTPWSNKVALVTGGSSGIGRALAGELVSRGAAVVVCARSAEAIDATLQSLGAGSGRVIGTPADVRNKGEVEAAVRATLAAFGRIDLLFNAAGVAGAAPSETLDEAEWDRIVDTNLKGTFLCCQAAGRVMLEQRSGAIVNFSSIVALDAFPKRAAYASSKAAVVMLTQVLAAEWADRGVRVNAVAPGVVRTEMNERMIAAGHLDLAAIERRTPMHRRGESREIVSAVLHLASDEASFTTGACLTVDGGWTSYGFL